MSATHAKRIAMAHNAGDPDDALPLRIDVVQAAMRVMEAHENVSRLNDYELSERIDDAVEKLVRKCKLYRKACRSRSAIATDAGGE